MFHSSWPPTPFCALSRVRTSRSMSVVSWHDNEPSSPSAPAPRKTYPRFINPFSREQASARPLGLLPPSFPRLVFVAACSLQHVQRTDVCRLHMDVRTANVPAKSSQNCRLADVVFTGLLWILLTAPRHARRFGGARVVDTLESIPFRCILFWSRVCFGPCCLHVLRFNAANVVDTLEGMPFRYILF